MNQCFKETKHGKSNILSIRKNKEVEYDGYCHKNELLITFKYTTVSIDHSNSGMILVAQGLQAKYVGHDFTCSVVLSWKTCNMK